MPCLDLLDPRLRDLSLPDMRPLDPSVLDLGLPDESLPDQSPHNLKPNGKPGQAA